MARHTERSSTALSEAAGGDQLPTWDTVVAYVSFCGEHPNKYRVAWEIIREQRLSHQDGVVNYDPTTLPDAPELPSNLPRHPAQLFLGRDSALAEMNAMLCAAEKRLGHGPDLHGLGGIGKNRAGASVRPSPSGRVHPTDTAAALLAAWHGFGTAEAAGGLLAQNNPDDAVLAHNAQPVFVAVAVHLSQAPSLPHTDRCLETVDGLTPPDYHPSE